MHILNKHILIAHRQPLLVLGLRSIIKDIPDTHVVFTTTKKDHALEYITRARVDMIIVDIELEPKNPQQVIRDILSVSKNPKILVHSKLDEEVHARWCIQNGACGYLPHSASLEECSIAIQDVLYGEVYMSYAERQRFQKNLAEGRNTQQIPLEYLSSREREVFNLISQMKTTRQIAKALGVSEKTVETHKSHIKEKLHCRNASHLAKLASGYATAA